jgi:hypothetical protein
VTINVTKWAGYIALVQALTMWAYRHWDAARELLTILQRWYANFGGP